MRSIGMAFARDFWRRARWYAATDVAGIVFIIYLIHAFTHSLRPSTTVTREDLQGCFIFVLIVQLLLLCPHVLMLQCDQARKWGFPYRYFRLPLSTSALVGWQLVLSMSFMVVLSLAAAFGFRVFYGAWPPLLVPAVLLAVVMGCVQALMWGLSGGNFLRLPAIGAVLWFFGQWIYSKLLVGGVAAALLRASLHRTDWAAMLGVVAAAYALAVHGVGRDRRGELGSFNWTLASLLLAEWRPERRRGFRSPAEAQCWLEWRQKGMMMPQVMVFALILIAGFMAYFHWTHGLRAADALDVLIRLSYSGILVMSVPIGMIIGNCAQTFQKHTIDQYRATRPVRDRVLAFAVMRCAGLTILASWAVCMAAVLALLGWMALHGTLSVTKLGLWRELVLNTRFSWLGFWVVPLHYGLILLCAWSLLLLFALPAMSGRAGQAGGVLLLVGVGLLSNAIIQIRLTPYMREFMAGLWSSVLGAGFILGAWNAFLAAGRRGVIVPWLRWVGAAFCVGALAATLVVMQREPIATRIFVAGLCCLLVSPLALAPLAIHWNRHR